MKKDFTEGFLIFWLLGNAFLPWQSDRPDAGTQDVDFFTEIDLAPQFETGPQSPHGDRPLSTPPPPSYCPSPVSPLALLYRQEVIERLRRDVTVMPMVFGEFQEGDRQMAEDDLSLMVRILKIIMEEKRALKDIEMIDLGWRMDIGEKGGLEQDVGVLNEKQYYAEQFAHGSLEREQDYAFLHGFMEENFGATKEQDPLRELFVQTGECAQDAEGACRGFDDLTMLLSPYRSEDPFLTSAVLSPTESEAETDIPVDLMRTPSLDMSGLDLNTLFANQRILDDLAESNLGEEDEGFEKEPVRRRTETEASSSYQSVGANEERYSSGYAESESSFAEEESARVGKVDPIPIKKERKFLRDRDDEVAVESGIPLTAAQIWALSTEEYTRLIRANEWQLNEAQLEVVRRIRRRGKNKLAARNSRARREQTIEELARELDEVMKALEKKREKEERLEEEIRRERERVEEMIRRVTGERGSVDEFVVAEDSKGDVLVIRRDGV